MYQLLVIGISIHALLAESDENPVGIMSSAWNFYPRSPCGERLSRYLNKDLAQSISIHALLAESDHINAADFHSFRISIHALLAESDSPSIMYAGTGPAFLSTLSLRRATSCGRGPR